ncbi:MAG: transposase [Acidobacteriaceae bacterium]
MKPTREHATNNAQTYMLTSSSWGRRDLFRHERWARLFVDTLYKYRGSAYLLHEFVIMPDHIHVLLTPLTSLEKAVQFIKGGFSYRVKKELGSNMEIWQKGFSDHRIRDPRDYAMHVLYIHNNPVQEGLCTLSERFPYSSAFPGFELDPAPQGLKPLLGSTVSARLEGVPLQSNTGSQSLVESRSLTENRNLIESRTLIKSQSLVESRSLIENRSLTENRSFIEDRSLVESRSLIEGRGSIGVRAKSEVSTKCEDNAKAEADPRAGSQSQKESNSDPQQHPQKLRPVQPFSARSKSA